MSSDLFHRNLGGRTKNKTFFFFFFFVSVSTGKQGEPSVTASSMTKLIEAKIWYTLAPANYSWEPFATKTANSNDRNRNARELCLQMRLTNFIYVFPFLPFVFVFFSLFYFFYLITFEIVCIHNKNNNWNTPGTFSILWRTKKS